MNYVVYFVRWEVDFGEDFFGHLCSFGCVVGDGAFVFHGSGDVV